MEEDEGGIHEKSYHRCQAQGTVEANHEGSKISNFQPVETPTVGMDRELLGITSRWLSRTIG